MAKPKIITIENHESFLREKSKELDKNQIKDPVMQKFFKNLVEIMFRADGLGLAAPQLKEHIRVIAINLNNEGKIFINPQIIKKSLLKNASEEGCLSVPNIYGKVKRHNKITVDYYDENGDRQILVATNLIARVLQHEIDHLDGILFIDKLEK